MKRLLMILMASCALFSCQKDDLTGGATPDTGKTTVTFTADGFDEVSTRANTNDTQIKDITVLQFVNGSLVVKEQLSAINFGQVVELDCLKNMPVATMEEVEINGETVKRMKEDNAENVVVFLANDAAVAGSVIDLELNASYADYKAKVYTSANLTEVLPMTGYYTNGIVEGATNQMNVTLTRSVAKINFTVNTTNFFEDKEQASIKINSITLHNVPNSIAPYAERNRPALPEAGAAGVWQGAQVPFPAYTADGFDADYTFENQSTSTTGFTVFMPENVQGSYDDKISKNSEKHPLSGGGLNGVGDADAYTYILVDLDYTMPSTGIIKNATYRIYLGGNATGDMNLLRNTSYNVTTYIYGANIADTRITVENLWNPTEEALNFGSLALQKVANCYIINDTPVDNFTISLLQAREGWGLIDSYLLEPNDEFNQAKFDELIKSSNWSIKTAWRTWGSDDANANITGEKANVTRKDNGGGAGEENFFATLDFSKLTESYAAATLASEGHNAVIELVDEAGNTWWSWHLWFTDYNPNAANDTDMHGRTHTYDNDMFAAGGAYNGKKMMDRNLGATITGWNNGEAPVNADGTEDDATYDATIVKHFGLVYQFGRKDPFAGAAAVNNNEPTNYYNADGTAYSVSNNAVDNNSNTYTLASGVLNPTTFYKKASGNWSNETAETDLWGKDGVKSPFDPSPAGWRVPKKGTWDGFNATDVFKWSDHARIYTGVSNQKAFYPASGYRNNASGGLLNVGSYGFSWSALPSNSGYGYGLGFYSTGVNPSGSNNRSYGMPVRPIQE